MGAVWFVEVLYSPPCHHLIIIGIVIYEYLITLDLEIERFWKRKTKGLGSVLFYVNRYLTLLGNIGIIVLFMSPELVLRHNVSGQPQSSHRCFEIVDKSAGVSFCCCKCCYRDSYTIHMRNRRWASILVIETYLLLNQIVINGMRLADPFAPISVYILI